MLIRRPMPAGLNKWRRVFAWWPRRVTSRTVAWLQWVETRQAVKLTSHPGYVGVSVATEYRLPPP